jgi:hypothetical protein
LSLFEKKPASVTTPVFLLIRTFERDASGLDDVE